MIKDLDKLSKALNNPIFYLLFLIRKVESFVYFPFRWHLYNKIAINSYISLKSSIRNHKNIYVGKNVEINSFVVLWPTNLFLNDGVQLNPGTCIYGNVRIGKNCMIGPNCMLSGGNHVFSNASIPMKFQGSIEKGIIINDNVWIGANCVILDGVVIGSGTIIGAGSVVTKNLDSNSIYIGNPARFIKKRYV